MADFKYRFPENVPGKYYVAAQCTTCSFCTDIAPNNFRRTDQYTSTYVFKQPTTPEEIALCEVAVEVCPCEEIGNDGDRFVWDEPAYRLAHAAARGDVLGVKAAIADGCDVNAEWNCVTPLIAAVQAAYEKEVGIEPYVAITGLLLGHGAAPNRGTKYFTGPLPFATSEHKRPIAFLLKKFGAKTGDSSP